MGRVLPQGLVLCCAVFQIKVISQRKWEPVPSFYMRVYQFVKWLTPHACKTTFAGIHRALFVQNLKYPLNKVVIREDDL